MCEDQEESTEPVELSLGDEVYWTDPDGGLCSSYATVTAIRGDFYCLRLKDGGVIEAFKHELS